MNDKETGERQYPFEVKYDDEIDPSSVTFRVLFDDKLPEDRGALETKVKNWASKGINEGFNGKYIHYLDDEPDEEGEGGFEWDEREKYVEFFVDMGKAEDEALRELYSSLSEQEGIKEIKIGSGYEW